MEVNLQSDAVINMALGVLSCCSAQLQRRVEKLKRHLNAISAWHSTIYHSNNSNNLCQWLQNYCRWDVLYYVSPVLQQTFSAIEQKRSWVRSNNWLHKVFILITQKKAATISDFEKIQGMFRFLDSLMPISLRQKGLQGTHH